VRILVDTNILYWVIADPARLSTNAKSVLSEADNEIWSSALSVAELRIKEKIGKLLLPDDFASLVERSGFRNLPLTFDHANRLSDLPLHHRDPFDRLLIAQAIDEGLTILTSDGKFELYPVSVIKN
jgi:PIN domain nuclease of toxin-antitoxin system